MKNTILGFTGSRLGMSQNQCDAVFSIIDFMRPDIVLHGMCVGADQEFHELILEYFPKIKIHGYPGFPRSNPDDDTWAMPATKRVLESFDVIHLPAPFLARNKEIVRHCDQLVATPASRNQTGGTWITINMARKVGKPVHVFYNQLERDYL